LSRRTPTVCWVPFINTHRQAEPEGQRLLLRGGPAAWQYGALRDAPRYQPSCRAELPRHAHLRRSDRLTADAGPALDLTERQDVRVRTRTPACGR